MTIFKNLHTWSLHNFSALGQKQNWKNKFTLCFNIYIYIYLSFSFFLLCFFIRRGQSVFCFDIWVQLIFACMLAFWKYSLLLFAVLRKVSICVTKYIPMRVINFEIYKHCQFHNCLFVPQNKVWNTSAFILYIL